MARSGADGYTLMLTGPSTFAAAVMQKIVPFALQDFVPITVAVERVSVLVVNGALVRALTNPELRPKFDQEGLLVIANTPEEFATALKMDMETHFKAMAVAGIKPE